MASKVARKEVRIEADEGKSMAQIALQIQEEERDHHPS